MLESGIDTLIMGCTHYPLLRSTLRQIMGEKVNLVNPAYETARELKALLERDGLNNDGKQSYEGAMHEFYVSDAANKFKNFANSILPYGVDTTQLTISRIIERLCEFKSNARELDACWSR